MSSPMARSLWQTIHHLAAPSPALSVTTRRFSAVTEELKPSRSPPPVRSFASRLRSPAGTGALNDLINKSRLYNLSVYRSLFPMRSAPRRKIKRIHLPTHYVEVSYRLRKAVVFYHPSIAHIPHGVKDRNPVLVTSGAKRGQNT